MLPHRIVVTQRLWLDAAHDPLRFFDEVIKLRVRSDVEFAEALEELGEIVDRGVAEDPCWPSSVPLSPSSSVIRGTLEGVRFETELPTVGRHQALNAAAALMAAHAAGVKVWAAADALGEADLPAMRMQALSVMGGTVLLDAYNASPAGMAVAIATLADLPARGRRMAVIGEMKELGEMAPQAHREVGEALNAAGVERALFYGEGAAAAMATFEGDGAMAATLEDVTAFLRMMNPGDLVLVKGSRALELERALEPLKGAKA